MKYIFLVITTFLLANFAYGQKTSACFTDTTIKNIAYPIVKCKTANLQLDNCSTSQFDSAVWRIYFSTNTNCTGYSQNYDIINSGAQSNSSINIPINQFGSYAVTLYLYNTSAPNQLIDSIQKCVFVYSDPIITTLLENLCNGSSYSFNGKTLTTSGIFTDTLQSIEGCDSIVNLTLNFYGNPAPTTINVTRCAGSPYFFNNQYINTSGIYYDTLVSFSQCDSIVELKFNIITSIPPVYYSNSLCFGQSLMFFGDTLTQSGTYFDTIPSYQGCDSIIAMNLTVYQAIPITNIYDTICYNTNFNFNGTIISNSGDYLDTLQSLINGCDSTIQLHLYIRPNTSFIDIYDTTCINIPYLFNGSTFTASGNYGFTLVNEFGCDSSMMLHLHVISLNPQISKQGDTLIASGSGTIQWIDCSTNLPIQGATNNIFVPAITGFYAAIITGNNCIESTDCVGDTIIDGIENIKLISSISVYPNPVLSTLHIKHLNNIKHLNIQNILGESCLATFNNIGTKEASIDVSKLPQGTYICKIIDELDNITYHKFNKK
jgi:hypothetical protein